MSVIVVKKGKYNMKEQTCCFTGHRNIAKTDYETVYKNTKIEVENLIKNGYRFFGTGGAIGFDTIAAKVVLELRQQYNSIRLILVLPCKNQTQNWNAADIKTYNEIKSQANKVVYSSQQYEKGCMLKRNRHLVDYSSACIAYLNRRQGGTAYTVNYAEKCGLTINFIKNN